MAEIGSLSSAYVVAPTPIETVVSSAYPPIDVVFVIDTSCSMLEEQLQLGESIGSFLEPVLAHEVDVHIGVVSTDMLDTQLHAGKLQVAADVSFIEPLTPDPHQVFAQMAFMGTSGDAVERGRAAAYTLIEIKRDFPRNAGFYREEALLHLVFISDEQDQSGPSVVTPVEFQDWMSTLKVRAGDVVAHGVFWLPGAPCAQATSPGPHYLDYTDWTGGLAFDICELDWQPHLDAIASHVLDSARVELEAVPFGPSVRVELVGDGGPIPLAASEYRLEDRFVVFDQGTRPAAGDEVHVVYDLR